jgi:aspartyl-tRNA synthetase
VKNCKTTYLDKQDFIEVETPMLGKSTPEGARDYLVPSRTFPNHFFALPQSPQLYKQLLMLSGVNRYFQIAKCFRDEDLRADRQPEFTQIDLEMSFINKEEPVINLVENFITTLFEQTKELKLKTPFPRMTYHEAINSYGTDKPDIRFELKIKDISDLAKHSTLMPFKACVESGGSVRVLNGKNMFDKLTRSDLEKLVTFVKEFGAPGLSYVTFENNVPKSPLIKFFTKEQFDEILNRANIEENDVLFFIADKDNDIVLKSFGKLRLHLAERFGLIDKNEYAPVWVTDFPLFEFSEEEGRYVAKHHPFTSPKEEDLPFLETEPQKVRAKAYDLVMNGYELGGGSIRISNPDVQKRMFKALGFSEERIQNSFGFFVEAFEYGAPPHGGMALGLDRLVMLLTKTDDIKEVIAFPKIQSAMDPLTKAPGKVEQTQLDELFLSLVEPKEDETK